MSLTVQSLLLIRERDVSTGSQIFDPVRHQCNVIRSIYYNVLEKRFLSREESFIITMAI